MKKGTQYLKKRGDVYYSNIFIPGSSSPEHPSGRCHVEALSADLETAKSMRDKLLERYNFGVNAGLMNVANMSYEFLLEKILNYYTLHRNKFTTQIVVRAFGYLQDAVHPKKVSDVTPAALEALREYWLKIGMVKRRSDGKVGGDGATGCNRKIRAIIAAMRWFEVEHDLPAQNWRKVLKNKWIENGNRKIIYSHDQLDQLYRDTADDEIMRTLFMIGYNAGLRRAEIRHTWTTDIDFDNELLHVQKKRWVDPETGEQMMWEPKGANGLRDMTRSIPMPKDGPLWTFLRERVSRIPGPWLLSETAYPPCHADTLTHHWHKIVRGKRVRPGVRVGNVHTLRHTFATEMLRRGELVQHVQKWMGHTTVGTTQKTYDHFMPTKSPAMQQMHVPKYIETEAVKTEPAQLIAA